jgi:hypothetical protein
MAGKLMCQGNNMMLMGVTGEPPNQTQNNAQHYQMLAIMQTILFIVTSFGSSIQHLSPAGPTTI